MSRSALGVSIRTQRPAAVLMVSMVSVVSVAAPAVATSTLDPEGEVGPNDFRISNMGPNGNAFFDATGPAVAYNPDDDRFLVVWGGDDDTLNELEIHGQLVAPNGAEIGPDFRISEMGPDGNAQYIATSPAVAYNPDTGQFLVVWSGDDNTGSLVEDEFEIFGQFIDGATGAQEGSNDFRISDMGPDGNRFFDASLPAVAYNPDTGQFLVVWSGDDNIDTLVSDDFEIFGQLINGATGEDEGDNDFRISDMGPDGNTIYRASSPAVEYNPDDDRFLVTWHGDDDSGDLVNDENEIYGQFVDGATGSEEGANDFRISDMGPDGDPSYDGTLPAVAYNSGNNRFLVTWYGQDNTGALVLGEFEVFGQFVDGATGTQSGINDFRISDMGPDGDTSYFAIFPAVAHSSVTGEFLVVWSGDDNTGTLVDGEFEIFGQRLDSTGTEIGDNDVRLSDMGPEGDINYGTARPAVAYNPNADRFLTVWDGDDDTGTLIDGELEIFGQLFEPPPVDSVGLVDTSQGVWHLRNSVGTITTFGYGNPGDLPIAGDWNGDGVATPGLYRQSDGFFYSRNSNTTGIADAACFAGDPGDIPVVGDWDGDGDDNLGIYRPSLQKFFLFTVTCTGSPMGAAQIEFLFGNPGDQPVSGDWDDDGITEVGLHRESTGFFYWRNTLTTGIADGEIFFGDPNDRFVAGDWGIIDGTDTPAIFRPSDLTFYFRHTLTQGVADSQFTWVGAGSGWLPVSGTFGLG